MPSMEQIIFVYNADAGLFSTLSDFTHKILSPGTYQCNLCKITYGNFAMKKEWREFLETLPQKKVFLHKNEFYKEYPQFQDTYFPTIFAYSREGIRPLISADEINQQENIGGLKKLIEAKINKV